MKKTSYTGSKILIQIIAGMIILAIATVAGIYVEKFSTKNSNRIRYLDFKVDNSNLLSAPAIQGQHLKILLGEKPINNLHQLTVKLFNFSDVDYENIPVYLELLPNNNEKFNVVSVKAVGSKSIPEIIENIKIDSSNNSHKHRYGYKIKTANRGKYGSESHILLVTFLITGNAPDIKININKKGVKSQRFNYFDYRNKHKLFPEWVSDILPIMAVLIFYGIMVFIAFKFQKRTRKKQREKHKAWLKEKISDKALIDRILELRYEYDWVSYEPKFLRSFLGPEKPNEIKEKD